MANKGFPNYTSYGANDISAAAANAITKVELGQVILNSYIFAAKGPETMVCDGGDLKTIYGDSTFDDAKKWYKHSTRFAVKFASFGSKVNVTRLIADDAKNQANAIVYIDLAEKDLPNYVRDSKGKYVPTGTPGEYKVDPDTPTIKGCVIKLIKDFANEVGKDAPALGSYTDPQVGSMMNSDGSKSKLLPMVQAVASSKGKEYELSGFSLSSISEKLIDRDILASTNAMTYKLALHEKPNFKSSPVVKKTKLGDKNITCTLKSNTVNPTTKGRLDIADVLRNNWFNDNAEDGPLDPSDYEGIYVYEENIQYVLDKIKSYEAAHISMEQKTWDDGEVASNIDWFDYSTADLDDEEHLINILTCKSTKSVPYYTVVKDTSTENLPSPTMKVVNISENTPIMLEGGGDGTMDDKEFNKLVSNKLAAYGDEDSYLNDCLVSKETMFIDSGFDVEVKEQAFKFITHRKDTSIILSTYEHSKAVKGIPLSNAEELAMAMRLKTAADLAPESIYYGTYCARAALVIGGGNIKGGSKELIPNTFELASYISEYMGASNGSWKNGKLFDKSCYSRELINTVPKDLGATARKLLFEAGAIFPITSDRTTPKFLGLQTMYPDPTSVVNNIFTMVALGTSERIAKRSWIRFGGDVSSTPEVFTTAVRKDLIEAHDGIFDNVFDSIPRVYLTEKDKINGNSWRVVTGLAGNVAKIDCTHSTEISRKGD